MKINQLNTITSPDVADGVAVGVGSATWRLSMGKLLDWIETNWGCDCGWTTHRSPQSDLVWVDDGEGSHYGFTPPMVPGQDLQVLVEWDSPEISSIVMYLPPAHELTDRQRIMLCPTDPDGCYFQPDIYSLGTHHDLDHDSGLITSPGINAVFIRTFHCPIYEYHATQRRWVNVGYGKSVPDP